MRWVLPMVLVAVLAAAAGGLVARQLYAEPESAAAPAVLPSPVPPSEQPGDPTVMGTPEAVAHPLFGTVHALLQTYYDAINARDYGRWLTVVTTQRAKNEPEDRWRLGYRSTRDGSIAVWRIETGPADTARVMVSLTSVQKPEDAPPELPEPCIRWWVVLPLGVEGGAWKVDSGPASVAPQHEKC